MSREGHNCSDFLILENAKDETLIEHVYNISDSSESGGYGHFGNILKIVAEKRNFQQLRKK